MIFADLSIYYADNVSSESDEDSEHEDRTKTATVLRPELLL